MDLDFSRRRSVCCPRHWLAIILFHYFRFIFKTFRHLNATPLICFAAMVKELTFTTIGFVLDSWEKLRRLKNYEEKAGSNLFVRLFERAPQTKVLFGFPIDVNTSELKSSNRFLMHAVYLIQMLDTALNMLGK